MVQYCELKEKGGWLESLSSKEKYTMERLEQELGSVNLPAKEVRAILVDITDRLKLSLDEILSELEDTLHDLPWKIKQMKQQQQIYANEEMLKIVKNLVKDWNQEFSKAQKGVSRNPWKQILLHVSDFVQDIFSRAFSTVMS